MILVIGSARARPGSSGVALKLSLEHVARSRKEPGCLSHEVSLDAEDDHRLVFVERWRDRVTLKAHFQLPSSREFVSKLGALLAEAPTLSIYESQEVEVVDL